VSENTWAVYGTLASGRHTVYCEYQLVALHFPILRTLHQARSLSISVCLAGMVQIDRECASRRTTMRNPQPKHAIPRSLPGALCARTATQAKKWKYNSQ
jgi:hypothetical protein